MSGSPRRTPGLRSSPLPQSEFSSPTSTHVAAKRTINLTHPLPQASKSPLKQARTQSHPDSEEEEEEEQNKDEDEKEEEEEDKDEEASAGEHVGEEGGAEEGAEQEESEVEDGGSGSVAGDAADFSDDAGYLIEGEAEDNGFVEGPGDYHEAADHGDVDAESSEAEEEQAGKSPVPVLNTASKGKKRKESEKNLEEKGDDKPKANHSGKGRGRKPKSRQEDHDQEPNIEDENPRPAKKAKKTAKSTNLQMTVDQEKELQNVVENITKNDGPLNKKRSLYILRRETPSDDTVRHTRSGRISVRPLAYWRNEKCVYGTGEAEVGQRFPLSTIKEIIRTEDPAIDQSGRKRGSKKKSKSKKKGGSESDDEPDENAEPWETQEGVFYGPVKIWDPEKQAGTQEEEMMGKIYYLFLCYSGKN